LDALYDAGSGSWTLQQISAGGKTNRPAAAGPFVSVFLNEQRHVFYLDNGSTIWDAFHTVQPTPSATVIGVDRRTATLDGAAGE